MNVNLVNEAMAEEKAAELYNDDNTNMQVAREIRLQFSDKNARQIGEKMKRCIGIYDKDSCDAEMTEADARDLLEMDAFFVAAKRAKIPMTNTKDNLDRLNLSVSRFGDRIDAPEADNQFFFQVVHNKQNAHEIVLEATDQEGKTCEVKIVCMGVYTQPGTKLFLDQGYYDNDAKVELLLPADFRVGAGYNNLDKVSTQLGDKAGIAASLHKEPKAIDHLLMKAAMANGYSTCLQR